MDVCCQRENFPFQEVNVINLLAILRKTLQRAFLLSQMWCVQSGGTCRAKARGLSGAGAYVMKPGVAVEENGIYVVFKCHHKL